MKIRKITRKDLKILAKFDAEQYKSVTEEQAFKVFQHTFKNRVPGACLIAEEDGEIIGYVLGEKKITFIRNAAYVKSIVVRKKWRGKGIGTKLMKECLSAMKKYGIKSVSLSALGSNRRAISLYKDFGFKPFRILFERKL